MGRNKKKGKGKELKKKLGGVTPEDLIKAKEAFKGTVLENKVDMKEFEAELKQAELLHKKQKVDHEYEKQINKIENYIEAFDRREQEKKIRLARIGTKLPNDKSFPPIEKRRLVEQRNDLVREWEAGEEKMSEEYEAEERKKKDAEKKRKELEKKLGGGLWDVIKDPIGTIKEAFAPVPTKLNNISTRTLEQWGNIPISSPIIIARTPLNRFLTGALDAVSLGKFGQLQKKYKYDSLFHLLIIVIVNGQRIIIEKNEVVNVAPFKPSDVNNKTEYYQLNFNPSINLTLNKMLMRTKAKMGDHLFYSYSALGNNNCQDFVRNLLGANGLATQPALNFIYQNLNAIVKELRESGFGYVPRVVDAITDLGSKVSRIIGKGKEDSYKPFVNFVANEGLRFL